MTREQALIFLKAQLEPYLQSKGIDTRRNFKCLICDGGYKTPNMSYHNNRIHCFACGADMDIISLIGHETGKSGADLFEYCYSYFNVPFDGRENSAYARNNTGGIVTYYQTVEMRVAGLYERYIADCKAHIAETDYFIRRGLSPAVIERHNLGYDPAKKVVIIPYDNTNSYYISRHVDEKAYYKPKTSEAGLEPVYNLKSLYEQNRPVCVVEGAIDALSVIEAGCEAIALNGTGYHRLVSVLTEKPTNNVLILSLDNDEAGRKAGDKLYAELQATGALCVKFNISGEHKDPNEALTADRNTFLQAVQDAKTYAGQYVQYIEDIKKAESEAEKEKYISETSVGAYRMEFQNSINESVNISEIPTGFPELDKTLDDGLYDGLYIVGAISSLGKTSFVLQIADQIAQQGYDVLFFSLEMSKSELIAKSISRITFFECDGDTKNAKTTRGITAGKRYLNYSPAERELIISCTEKYFSYAEKHIYISEGMGDVGVNQIKESIEKHIKATGNKPVVIIDYLQILAPVDIKASDKQNTDKAVFELKRLSRDLKIPVIGISSLNRENYNTAISMSAFKESGAIEYSSDVLIGLQFETTELTAESINRMKRQQPRKIELKVLKNRNGVTGDSITFDYYPMFNYFRETGKKAVETDKINAKNNVKR